MRTKLFSRCKPLYVLLFFAMQCSVILNAQVTVSLSASPGTIAPAGTAQLTANVTGTSTPLKYRFTGVNTSGVAFLDSINPCTVTGPGIYTVLVMDTNYIALGIAKDTVFSTVSASGSYSIIDSVYSCAGGFGGGEIVLNYTGLFVPVTVGFSPLGPFPISNNVNNGEPFADTIAGFGTGAYTMTIKDALGQIINANINVPVSGIPDFSSYITASPDTIEPGQSTTITVHFVGGLPPYSALVTQALDTAGVTINTTDSVFSFTTQLTGLWHNSNAIDVGTGPVVRCNVYGGQVLVTGNCVAGQCVWPGDADWDGVVNNFDLLPIGIAYDSTGYPRADTSITWFGHYALNWTDSLQDSINYKYIDCNGNGIINADDTLAIMQNYSLTYTRSGGNAETPAGSPVLYPGITQDTVYNGDTLTVQLVLGNSTTPATNVYGLAFTLNYDRTVVDTSKTKVTLGNSWLGTSADKISLSKDFKAIGQLPIALTRINHLTKSGSGPIGTVSFVITTDNLNGKTYSYYKALFYISDVKMVDSVGNILPLGTGYDSTEIGFLPTNIWEIDNADNPVHLYPNPANQKLVVTSGYAIGQIKIIDMLGNEAGNHLYAPNVMITQQLLDITGLAPGIYTVEVLTEKGISVKKLVVAR